MDCKPEHALEIIENFHVVIDDCDITYHANDGVIEIYDKNQARKLFSMRYWPKNTQNMRLTADFIGSIFRTLADMMEQEGRTDLRSKREIDLDELQKGMSDISNILKDKL